MKKYILLVLIILWMGVIFMFSSCNGKESTNQSNTFINMTISKIVKCFNPKILDEELDTIVKKVSMPIRKLAHMSEYFILSMLICMYINCYNINIKRNILITFIICFLYACSDEIHQLFIKDRSGNIIDVFIDSFGAFIWIIIFYLRRKNENCNK